MSGEHERRLAIGTIAQQGAQAIAFVSMLAVVTVLGRRLSLTEFGTYGLFASMATYLLFAQNSVETAAVKLLAPAEGERRDQVFSTAVVVYVGAGLISGLVVALAGALLPGPLGVPDDLQGDVRLGAAITGLLMLAGWPVKAHRDVLRAGNLFRRAAFADAFGFLFMAVTSVVLALADAPLWSLLAAAGTAPAATGLMALVLLEVARAQARFRAAPHRARQHAGVRPPGRPAARDRRNGARGLRPRPDHPRRLPLAGGGRPLRGPGAGAQPGARAHRCARLHRAARGGPVRGRRGRDPHARPAPARDALRPRADRADRDGPDHAGRADPRGLARCLASSRASGRS